jgi:hypothetical protein
LNNSELSTPLKATLKNEEDYGDERNNNKKKTKRKKGENKNNNKRMENKKEKCLRVDLYGYSERAGRHRPDNKRDIL